MGKMLTLTDLMPTDEGSTFEDYLMPRVLVTYKNNKRGQGFSKLYNILDIYCILYFLVHTVFHALLTTPSLTNTCLSW